MTTDKRYVYSASCTFHGPISSVGSTGGKIRLPCCPSCGSMLFEHESKEVWDRQIEEYATKKDDSDYPEFMAWFGALRPCRPFRTQQQFDALRAEFNALKS